MTQLSSEAHRLKTIRLRGEDVVRRLDGEYAEAEQELSFLEESCAVLESAGIELPEDKEALVKILAHRKVLNACRRNTAKLSFEKFTAHIDRIICRVCFGMGQIRFIICEDESGYKDCYVCGGTGLKR